MKIINLATIVLVLVCSCGQTRACDCLATGSVKTEVRRSNLVAVVRTIAQDTVKFTNHYGRSDYKWEYTFLVIRKYKGDISSDTIHVSTPYGETACGFFFKINQEYMLYGYNSMLVRQKVVKLPENNFKTSSCSRTKGVDAQEEAAIITALKE
jgi:hypothetical protein